MIPYTAPVDDLRFVLNEVVGLETIAALPNCDSAAPDLVDAVLEEAGKFASGVLAPLNRVGDKEGSVLENGVVRTPTGWKDAYGQFVESGWNSLPFEPEYGGQGLPWTVAFAVNEMWQASNLSFGLCPLLNQGAVDLLTEHASDEQKALYLPKMIAGEWTGTMNLTEPQAGSDLAAVRTRAVRADDGTYRITGQKIFITYGEHDLTDNIVHLVLARLPDAPKGSKGISLFLAPKFMVKDDGSLGDRNSFRPVGVEHKLGIHASPTCVMSYEGATAELVGEPNQGLAHMFIMMNAARLAVGVQGVGIAERAFQGALAYAQDRRQGRSIWTGEANAPILDHPDVRRMLVVMKAKIAAARAICLSTAVAADLANHAGSEDERRRWKGREDLFVPIAKAWSTDVGCEVASLGVQVHGGMGFIEETGAAQHYRDARIAPIYEGTNGIQAGDLVGRKLSQDGGESAKVLIADMKATLPELARILPGKPVERFAAGIESVEDATLWLLDRKAEADSAADVQAGADAYLKLMGDVVGGWMLAKGALEADRRLKAGGEDEAWLQSKIDLYEAYAANVLGHCSSRLAAVGQGGELLKRLGAEVLSA